MWLSCFQLNSLTSLTTNAHYANWLLTFFFTLNYKNIKNRRCSTQGLMGERGGEYSIKGGNSS